MVQCEKCKREHEMVSLAEWSWLVRDTKPKPPHAQLVALWMLAARLDARTGCGWTSDKQVAEDAAVSRSTVSLATRWARAHLMLHRPVRGHRISDEKRSGSLWWLIRPHPMLQQRDVGSDPMSQQRDVGPDPTSESERPNVRIGGDPMSGQPRTKRDQEVRPERETSSAARTSLLHQLNAKARAETRPSEFTDATEAEYQAWRARPRSANPDAVARAYLKPDRLAADLIEEMRNPPLSRAEWSPLDKAEQIERLEDSYAFCWKPDGPARPLTDDEYLAALTEKYRDIEEGRASPYQLDAADLERLIKAGVCPWPSPEDWLRHLGARRHEEER